MTQPCEHFDQATVTQTTTDVCRACLDAGDRWFHLRLCLVCGNVACCDTSPNKHATQHHHESGHPVIRSAQPDESWAYCYPHDLFLDDLPE